MILHNTKYTDAGLSKYVEYFEQEHKILLFEICEVFNFANSRTAKIIKTPYISRNWLDFITA